MGNTKFSRKSAIALTALAGFLAFASTRSFARKPPEIKLPEHEFTFRLLGDPETLDWNRAHTPIENNILINIMEGLLEVDDNLKIQPALASSWKVSKDGKIYTFKLRKDVKWSDGVPLKAADFVYSWKRLLSKSTGASYSYFLFDIENAEKFYKGEITDFSKVGVSAPDDGTVVVKLGKPVAHWGFIPTFWVTYPLREDVVTKHGAAWATAGRMVTVGPYRLVSQDLGSRIVLEPNPYYYGKRGNLEQVVAQVVTDDATALSLYEAGKLDLLTDISSVDLKRLEGRPDLKTYRYLKTGYLGFNLGKFPTNNPSLRKAISEAIDLSRISRVLYGGQKPAKSFVTEGMFGHEPGVALKYDPAHARLLFLQSGIEHSSGLKIELVSLNSDKMMTVGQLVQSDLKKNLGIDVVLQPFDHKTFRSQLDLGTYPLFLLSWSADYPDPDNYLSVFMSDSGNNKAGYKNAEFDKLVLDARQKAGPKGPKERLVIYKKLQEKLQIEDTAIFPLYYEPNLALVKARVKGFNINPINDAYLRKVSVGKK